MSPMLLIICVTFLAVIILIVADRAMKRSRGHLTALAAVVMAVGALATAFSAFMPPG